MADYLHPPSHGKQANPALPKTRLREKLEPFQLTINVSQHEERKRGRPRGSKKRGKGKENTKAKRPRVLLDDRAKRNLIYDYTRLGVDKDKLVDKYGSRPSTVNKLIKQAEENGGALAPNKKPGPKKGSSKYTEEQQIFVALCFLCGVSVSGTQVAQMFYYQWPFKDYKLTMCRGTANRIAKAAGLSFKTLRVRKRAWNTPRSIRLRKQYAQWHYDNRFSHRFLFYDEACFGTPLTRKHGWSVVGTQAMVTKDSRSTGKVVCVCVRACLRDPTCTHARASRCARHCHLPPPAHRKRH